MQKSIHILLIEDDPDDVELLQTALEDEGVIFESSVISHGDQVIPYLKMGKNLPTIIVLDLNIPKTHGKEVLLQLKASAKFNNIPVVILTTSSARAERDFCLEAGAAAFMIKPVTMSEFKDIVRNIREVIDQGLTP